MCPFIQQGKYFNFPWPGSQYNPAFDPERPVHPLLPFHEIPKGHEQNKVLPFHQNEYEDQKIWRQIHTVLQETGSDIFRYSKLISGPVRLA